MDQRSEAAKLLGAIGGKSNFERHGREHMQRIGKLGGRPRKDKPEEKTAHNPKTCRLYGCLQCQVSGLHEKRRGL